MTSNIVSLAWDPTNPGQAWAPRLSGQTKVVMEGIALAGKGCNDHELAALTKMIRSHEEYLEKQGDATNDRAFAALKALSVQYRRALRVCLDDWREDIDHNDGDGIDKKNYDLLRTMLSLLHISDIFLPLLVRREPYEMMAYESNQLDGPGVATADTVRYLRHHLLGKPCGEYDDAVLDEMLKSAFPEEFGDGQLYWKYVTKLLLRGCLEEVWEVLSKHSWYKKSARAAEYPQEDAENREQSHLQARLEEAYYDFMVLKDILSRAPLPGGRNTLFDDGLTSPEEDNDIDDAAYHLDDLDIDPSDYTLWELGVMSETPGEAFTAESAAIERHKLFTNYVKDLRRRGFRLCRRVPEIQGILSILCGDFSVVVFDFWAEKLCAELLYCHPNLRPSRISERARSIMKECPVEEDAKMHYECLLDIMEGNAGRALQMMWVAGGAGQAALPNTVTTLMSTMFLEYGILDQEVFPRKSEFLCSSADAIRASIDDHSAATSRAIRLLLPYAVKEGDLELVAAIAEILDHYHPSNDAEANHILSICRPLVEMKSAQILDSCCSVVQSRYRSHMSTPAPGDALHWLLTGIELEQLVHELPELGRCYGLLRSVCLATSTKILQLRLKEEDSDPRVLSDGEAMLEALEGQEDMIPEALVLKAALSVGRDSADEQADAIVAVLEDRTDETTGIRSCAAPRSLHWYFLRVAEVLIQSETKVGSGSNRNVTPSAFGKTGVTLLMERLVQLTTLATDSVPQDQIDSVKELLAKALAQAYVAENASKKDYRMIPPWRDASISQIRSTSLKEHNIAIQERVVSSMLNF